MVKERCNEKLKYGLFFPIYDPMGVGGWPNQAPAKASRAPAKDSRAPAKASRLTRGSRHRGPSSTDPD